MTTDHAFDPRFPDRPNVPEFWRLSEVVCGLDEEIDTGTPLVEVTERVIPMDVLTYMAKQRVMRVVGPLVPDEVLITLASIYLDGFVSGANYAKVVDGEGTDDG